MKRNATAIWQGSGKEGKGQVTTQSGLISNVPYNYHSRFEDGKETNPEELVAAAHAGCYSMKLSFVLGAAGFTPDRIETNCEVTLENGAITKSHLTVKATVPGIDAEKLTACINEAKDTCPLTKSLTAQTTVSQA